MVRAVARGSHHITASRPDRANGSHTDLTVGDGRCQFFHGQAFRAFDRSTGHPARMGSRATTQIGRLIAPAVDHQGFVRNPFRQRNSPLHFLVRACPAAITATPSSSYRKAAGRGNATSPHVSAALPVLDLSLFPLSSDVPFCRFPPACRCRVAGLLKPLVRACFASIRLPTHFVFWFRVLAPTSRVALKRLSLQPTQLPEVGRPLLDLLPSTSERRLFQVSPYSIPPVFPCRRADPVAPTEENLLVTQVDVMNELIECGGVFLL